MNLELRGMWGRVGMCLSQAHGGFRRQVRKLVSKDQVDAVLERGRELCLFHRTK